jgi:hypothetical protein
MWDLSHMVLHVSYSTRYTDYVLIMIQGESLLIIQYLRFRLITLAPRRHRKAMHQALNPQAMLSYQGLQLSKVHQMIRNILAVPQEMEAHLRT